MENGLNGAGSGAEALPLPAEVIVDDLRLVVVLAVKQGREVVERIALPPPQGAGLPLRLNEKAFAEAYQWIIGQLDRYQEQVDKLGVELEKDQGDPGGQDNGVVLPNNTVRLPNASQGAL